MIIKSFAKPDMASQNDARGCVNISCYRTNRRNFLCHSANPHLASQCSWAWRANHGLLHYCLQHFKYDVTGIHWMNNLRLNFFASLHYTACFKPRKVHSHGKLGKIVVKNVTKSIYNSKLSSNSKKWLLKVWVRNSFHAYNCIANFRIRMQL